MDFTVIVVTHNRAALLGETLTALSRLTYRGAFEVLVVDNNSTDGTRELVEQRARSFLRPLEYLFVPQPGKYGALNAGIRRAEGDFIAATDDDAYPEPDWLDQAAEGFRRYGCAFVGGPVYPVWRCDPPRWIDPADAITGKVLGLQDYGSHSREYGTDGISWPLGVNVAYRKDAFATAGLFEPRLGRVAGTLRNQSQREWHLRARRAGLSGMYLPQMVVHHSVESERLTPSYFRRWFYWHGVSRAILRDIAGRDVLEPEERTTATRRFLGLPLGLLRESAVSGYSAAKRRLTGRSDEAIRYELTVCFCAGVIRETLRHLRPPGRRSGPRMPASAPHPG